MIRRKGAGTFPALCLVARAPARYCGEPLGRTPKRGLGGTHMGTGTAETGRPGTGQERRAPC
jgi:hypothetical protein